MTSKHFDKWQSMGISKDDLRQMEKYYRQIGITDDKVIGRLLNPEQFEMNVAALNKDLAAAGFEFQIDGKEMLGIIVDMESINRHNKRNGQPEVRPMFVAVFRKIAAAIRKERGWTEKNEIPPKLLEERIQGLISRAKQKIGKSRI